MIGTAPKWKDIAENNLDKEDEIQKSYLGKLDGKGGILILSNEKLLFVNEEGFLRKTYDLTLDLPYDKISRITHEGRREIDLTDIEGKKYRFSTTEMSVDIIEKSIEEIRHQ